MRNGSNIQLVLLNCRGYAAVFLVNIEAWLHRSRTTPAIWVPVESFSCSPVTVNVRSREVLNNGQLVELSDERWAALDSD